MKRTHNPTVVPSLTLHPGDVLSIPLSGTMALGRIDQIEFDKFQLTLNTNGSDDIADVALVGINTRGYDRLQEPEPDYSTGTPRRRLIENADSLELKINDILSIPKFGDVRVLSVLWIRADRYQIRLGVKFQVAFDIDVVVKSQS